MWLPGLMECHDDHPAIFYRPEDWPAYRGKCPVCSLESAVNRLEYRERMRAQEVER